MKGSRMARRDGGGFTLVELLVVLFIVLSITAATLPVVIPSLENRRMREAAREVTTFLAGAQTKAIKTGRPVGVIIERDPILGQMATTLSIAQVPPPFSGISINADVFLEITFVHGPGSVTRPEGTVELDATLTIPPKFVRVGDQLRANHQGTMYTITGPDSDDDGFVEDTGVMALETTVELNTIYDDGGTLRTRALPWPMAGVPGPRVPFQIIRQPVRSAAAPMELPSSIIFDLAASGSQTLVDSYAHCENFDSSEIGVADRRGVIIMFSPNGSVERVYHCEATGANTAEWEGHHADSPLLFLLGRREAVGAGGSTGFFANLVLAPDGAPVTLENATNQDNLWIMINPQSGQVSVSEVAPVIEPDASDPLYNTDPKMFDEILRQSRAYALEAETLGGR